MTQPPDGYPPPHQPADHPTRPRAEPVWRGDQPTWPGGPAPGPPPPVTDYPSAGAPPYGPPGYGPPAGGPGYGPPGGGPPAGGPGYGPPGGPPGQPPPLATGPPPRRRRRMLLGSAVLAGVLVLCAAGGVGAWLLTRDPDRNGAASPAGAVQSFLQAVYRDLDPAAAASVVCSEARDEEALETKIDGIRAYEDTALNPSFSWSDPSVVEETEELAVVAVTVTMTTDDEKTSEQTLHVSVLDKDANGWWVCDLETVEEQPPDEDGGGEDSDE